MKTSNIHFLTVLLSLGLVVKQGISQKCRNIDANPDHRLINHVIDTIHGISAASCTMSCAKNTKCFSINYNKQSQLCEHNNNTKLFAKKDLIFEENSFYMEILERDYNPCLVEKPCKNDGKCSVDFSNASFSCQCTKHYTGQQCQTLKTIGDVNCQNKVLNLCQDHMKAWKAKILGPISLSLENCNPKDLEDTSELLLFVSRADASAYGKYDIVRVKEIINCTVILHTSIKLVFSGSPCEIIAQRFPNFNKVTLTQSCTLTCNARLGVVGGVMAFRAVEVQVDSTSKIEMNGKGYRGGAGGSSAGNGGYGGETFACLSSGYGQGGRHQMSGREGGGGGDGAAGGSGGLNSGGGGGDSKANNDDGAGGGGGGGHFSGGGGGGAGSGCSGQKGGDGGSASTALNAYAGGGGKCGCPGGAGGNGGSSGGNNGNNVRGGQGGSSTCGNIYGSGGGGGGFQYGSVDFSSRLSYGGGGGGGGGSQFGYAGGRGGHGGGLVLLFVDKLTLNGRIEAKGERGQCQPAIANHRGGSGGSGAGGSVVIVTKDLVGSLSGKIDVQGGPALSYAVHKCGLGPGYGGGGGVGRWVVKTSSTVYKSLG